MQSYTELQNLTNTLLARWREKQAKMRREGGKISLSDSVWDDLRNLPDGLQVFRTVMAECRRRSKAKQEARKKLSQGGNSPRVPPANPPPRTTPFVLTRAEPQRKKVATPFFPGMEPQPRTAQSYGL